MISRFKKVPNLRTDKSQYVSLCLAATFSSSTLMQGESLGSLKHNIVCGTGNLVSLGFGIF